MHGTLEELKPALFLSPSSKVLQTSLLFSKDYGLLSFFRKSLPLDEVSIFCTILSLIDVEAGITFDFFPPVAGHPRRNPTVFGEISGQSVAEGQRLGENLCHGYKSTFAHVVSLVFNI